MSRDLLSNKDTSSSASSNNNQIKKQQQYLYHEKKQQPKEKVRDVFDQQAHGMPGGQVSEDVNHTDTVNQSEPSSLACLSNCENKSLDSSKINNTPSHSDYSNFDHLESLSLVDGSDAEISYPKIQFSQSHTLPPPIVIEPNVGGNEKKNKIREKKKHGAKSSIWVGLKNALIMRNPKNSHIGVKNISQTNSPKNLSITTGNTQTLSSGSHKNGVYNPLNESVDSVLSSKSSSTKNYSSTKVRIKSNEQNYSHEYTNLKSSRRFSSNPELTVALRRSYEQNDHSHLNKSTSNLNHISSVNSSFDTDSFCFDAICDSENRSEQHNANIEQINASLCLKSEYPRVASRLNKQLKRFILDQGKTHMANPHHSIWVSQLVEIAQSCLDSLTNNTLNLELLYDLMDRIDKLINAISETDISATSLLLPLVNKLGIIISKPLRIMEIIEQSPTYLQDQIEYVLQQNPNQAGDLIKYLTNSFTTPIDFIDEQTLINIQNSKNQRASFVEYQDKIKLNDFKHIKDIGKGKYGKTTLVSFKDTGLVFCLKTVKKSHVKVKSQLSQLFAERDILFYLKDCFVVNLYCTFTTEESIYFLMEYVDSGSISNYLDMGLIFSSQKIKEILSQMVLALEFLHSKEIVHRDLKPGNILLTKEFNIKLADFGLSDFALKYELHAFTVSSEEGNHFAGTPYYIAPEVILNQPSGKPFDWWAVGIIGFEMLTTEPPFTGQTIDTIFNNILSGCAVWPPTSIIPYCTQFKDFITKLLVKDPANRLGTGHIDEIKKHSYFSDVDWEQIINDVNSIDNARGRKSLTDLMPVTQDDTKRNSNHVDSDEHLKKIGEELNIDLKNFSFVSKDILDLIHKSGDSGALDE